MGAMEDWPVWAMAVAIFLLRIGDVSIGTMRTISVIQGRIPLSVGLGFLEVLVWVSTVSQVLNRATESPVLLLAYASGFAAGNGVGVLLERRLALGAVIVRIVSAAPASQLAELLRQHGQHVFQFDGREGDQPVTLSYVIVRRRDAPDIVQRARGIDPELFFAVDPLRESSALLQSPLPGPTGWRAVMKKK